MGCGAGRLRRNVVAPSRHGNINNQAEEDGWRSQDEQQAFDFTDGVDKVTACDEVSKQDCDIQPTNDKQVNKQEELCTSSAEESVVNKQQGDQLQEINSKQHTGNKQENTKVKVQDGRVVNKQIQQEINNELDAPEDNKQQPINKQKDICTEVNTQDSVVSKQSDKETSEDSEDEEILKQLELIEWASASQGVNKQQIVDKQRQEVAASAVEQPVSLVEGYNDIITDKQSHKQEEINNDHSPPLVADINEGDLVLKDNDSLRSVHKQFHQLPTCGTIDQYTATRVSQQVESVTHHNVHSVNQQQQLLPTSTPPHDVDTLLLVEHVSTYSEMGQLTVTNNDYNVDALDDTLWMLQDDVPHSTPPSIVYANPYQCGVARSLSQSPRIVGLQLQLGFVNVTCAELDVLESKLSSTTR